MGDRIPVAPHVQELIAPYLQKMGEAKRAYADQQVLVTTILAAHNPLVLDGWVYDQGWLIQPEGQDARTGNDNKDEQHGGVALVPAGPGSRPAPSGPFLMPPSGEREGNQPEGS